MVANSQLKRQRLVLYRQHAQQGQRVTAVSPAAQRSGVQIGMTLTEARALLEVPFVQASSREQEAPCRSYAYQHDPAADQHELKQLALRCDWISPLIGIEEADAPSSLFLETTGVEHLFGGEAALQAQVRQCFHEWGYVVQTALASTMGVAWGFAHFGQAHFSKAHVDDAHVEPVSVDHSRREWEKRDEPEAENEEAKEWERFETLPIAALRLSAPLVDLLQQLGVQQVHQLCALPRASLLSRFGDELLQRFDQALGKQEEVILALQPPADFSVERLFRTSHSG